MQINMDNPMNGEIIKGTFCRTQCNDVSNPVSKVNEGSKCVITMEVCKLFNLFGKRRGSREVGRIKEKVTDLESTLFLDCLLKNLFPISGLD